MARGGKRSGAGRRKTPLSRAVTAAPVKRTTAEEVLASIDEREFWRELLQARVVDSVTVIGGKEGLKYQEMTRPDYKTRLEAGKYLTNRRDGMPAQSVDMKHSGAIVLRHSVPRPERHVD